MCCVSMLTGSSSSSSSSSSSMLTVLCCRAGWPFRNTVLTPCSYFLVGCPTCVFRTAVCLQRLLRMASDLLSLAETSQQRGSPLKGPGYTRARVLMVSLARTILGWMEPPILPTRTWPIPHTSLPQLLRDIKVWCLQCLCLLDWLIGLQTDRLAECVADCFTD